MTVPRVFVSYSHRDKDAKTQVIAALRRIVEDRVQFIDDDHLPTGSDWALELTRMREGATAALLLLSPEYLGSRTVRDELQHLFTLREERGLQLYPVVLIPCAWGGDPLLRAVQMYAGGEAWSPLVGPAAGAFLQGLAEALLVGLARARRRLVIMVHGIRTRAEWLGRLKHLFESDGRTIAVPAGYEYFDVVRFLCPIGTRGRPARTVLAKIRAALVLYQGQYDELIVVAHSFGTYLIGRLLRENPDLRPDRLLLCGAILSSSYAWEKLPNCPASILNEAGSRDIWPILAESCTWGFGSTGTFGFQHPNVRDRYHDLAHSDYFLDDFAERFWLPYIRNGEAKPTAFEKGHRPPTPFWKNLLTVVRVKWVFLIAIAGLGYVNRARFLHDARPTAHEASTMADSRTNGVTASIRGVVFDRDRRALQGVRVSLIGMDAFAVTDTNGAFRLSARVALQEQVVLHAEREGYRAKDQRHPAGGDPVAIYLTRTDQAP